MSTVHNLHAAFRLEVQIQSHVVSLHNASNKDNN